MNIFKNISIKQRFFILFFVCITTFVGFGTFALYKLNNLAEVTESLYNQSSKVSDATVNAKVNLVKINSTMKDLILSANDEEIQKEIDKVSEYEDELKTNLDTINENSDDANVKRNLQDAYNLLFKWWKPQIEKITNSMLEGKKDEAIDISKGISSDFVEQFELDLNNIYLSSIDNEINLIEESNELKTSVKTTLIFTLIILLGILLILFILIVTSILNPINNLKNHMIKTTKSGELEEYEITQKGEITEMAKNYNILIKKLKDELWVNTNRNALNSEMTGYMSVNELTQKTINVLSRLIEAENGSFYIFNEDENKLVLNSTFAGTKSQMISDEYRIGHGIIGQVALERKAILLKNVRRSESSSIDAICLNVYAFPLIYEEKLYGVIEISSFEMVDDLRKQFIDVISSTIAISLSSAIQNEKIKELLLISEEATNKAQEMSNQLKGANEILEEHQRQLQVQAEELQQTNAQLEEQQQILQQQSEEMQQTNAQLEENQLHMEEQSRLLRIKNEELEKSRKEILEQSKAYEMANKYKTQFLANISHELRTPLNSIILLSNLLVRSERNIKAQDAQEKIEVIYNSGQHLLSLINDILDLSKIEAGRIELNCKYFKSDELINELTSMFKETAMEKSIEFVWEDKFNDIIYGDKEKISQILRNFLSNAFKFTHGGLVSLKIWREDNCGDKVVFSVIDTGIGISNENLDIIFEEFHQGDGSISRKYGGTGLGLSISNKLCNLMNGEIKVVSEPGVGSTFSFYLPLTVPEDLFKLEDAITITNKVKDIRTKDSVNFEINETKKLLVIEDDINLSKSIKSISEGIGFVTLVSNNGADGIRIIKEKEINGILLDLSLPDKDGIDLLKEINTELKLRNLNIPIIIYTGMEINKEQEKEIRLYADSIIIKTTNSYERLLDELTLILHKKNDVKDYRNIITSKINKDKALNLSNKKILITDDDPRNIFVLAAALEEYGAEIIEAENGKVALDKLENETIDLILMDIMMPVMNGYEAIRAIRNTTKIKDIPIIATTAKSLKGDREKCMEAGANDYISKPIDYDVLITLVKAWINKV